MPIDILRQSNFTAGVIDDRLRRRDDLKFFQNGLAVGDNIIAHPQGEIVNRPGLAFVDLVRTALAEVALGGATITAPNGGTVAYLTGDDANWFKTTTVMSAADPIILWHVDFGAAMTVGLVLLKDYIAQPTGAAAPSAADPDYPWTSAAAASATKSNALKVQYSTDDATWHDFGYAADLGTILRSRLIATPPGQPVTARYWRLIKTTNADLSADVFWQGYVQFLKETGAESNARIWRFAFDQADKQYEVVATAGAAEVYQLGARVASFQTPYASDQLTTVRRAQRLDTLLTFHPDVAPPRITRQGAHSQWDVRTETFSNIPLFDYDGTNAGSVNEKQDLHFTNYVDGDTFNITYEGETSASITFITTSAATMAANIQAALEDLSGIGSGNVSVTGPSSNVYRVEFIGDMAGSDVSNLAPVTLSSSAGLVYMSLYARGQQGGEAMFSATRGWPRSGMFHQQRLFLGGLKLRPQTLLASRRGDYFNFNIKSASDDAGIAVDIDSKTAVTIQELYDGPTLQIFTDAVEYVLADGVINAPTPDIKQARGKRGLKAGLPVFEFDSGSVFPAAAGDMLCSLAYSFDLNGNASDPIAVQTSLIYDIVDIGFRRAKSTLKPDIAVIVRGDGGAAYMSSMSSQNVLGVFNMTTEGEILAATGDANGDMYLICRRHRPSGTVLTLERLDDSRMLDASVYAEGVMTQIGGLGHLEGVSVWLYVDGAYAGRATVTGGVAQLPRASRRTVEAGLWTPPRGRTLSGELQDPRAVGSLRVRSGEVRLNLGPTALLLAGMADKTMWPVPMARPALLDTGPGENLFDGWARLQGLDGFTTDAQIEFTQDAPGPLCIREIIITVSS